MKILIPGTGYRSRFLGDSSTRLTPARGALRPSLSSSGHSHLPRLLNNQRGPLFTQKETAPISEGGLALELEIRRRGPQLSKTAPAGIQEPTTGSWPELFLRMATTAWPSIHVHSSVVGCRRHGIPAGRIISAVISRVRDGIASGAARYWRVSARRLTILRHG
jgi:hypothetical protein